MSTRTRRSPLGSLLDLPQLSPEAAYVLVDVLDRVIASLWDKYGDEMLDVLAAAEPAEDQRPSATDLEIPF